MRQSDEVKPWRSLKGGGLAKLRSEPSGGAWATLKAKPWRSLRAEFWCGASAKPESEALGRSHGVEPWRSHRAESWGGALAKP